MALAFVWLAPALALGCPDCASARVVRASVFDQRFWPLLAMVLLPVVVVMGAAKLLGSAFDARCKPPHGDTQREEAS